MTGTKTILDRDTNSSWQGLSLDRDTLTFTGTQANLDRDTESP